MAGNLYDDAVEQLGPPPDPQAPTDPFADAAAQVAARRVDTLRTGLDRATATPPDRAAEVLDLSTRYGLPASVVERNYDSVRERARRDSTPYDQLVRETPALADYLSHPLQAAAVQDDLEPLAVLERSVRMAGNAIRAAAAGVNQFDAGVWGVAQQVGEATGNDYLAALGYNARHESIANAEFARGKPVTSNALEQAFYSGFESIGVMAPGLLLSLLGGGKAAMLGSIGIATEGEAYGRARDAGKSVGRSSLFGFTQSAVEVATEYIPAKWFLKDLASNAGFRAIVLHQIKAEIPGEQIATLLQDADEWATFNPTAPWSKYLSEHPFGGRAVETLVATITAVGAMSTVASAVSRMAGDGGRVERAEQAKGFFDTIARTVTSMKSAEKHPAAIETVIANATEGGGVEKLYAPIDTFTSYWQSVGEDPATKAAELTGDKHAYATALQTGNDLAIPTGVYAARIAATEHNAYFVNELRLAPDEMNLREATAFKEQQAAAAQAQADQATAAESPVGAIAVQLRQSLEAAGVERGTAASYVDLVESTFGNIAEIAVDPRAIFGQLGVKVERPSLGAPVTPETGAPAANEPRQATIPEVPGAPEAPVGAPGVAVAREPNLIPAATRETGITDETGRSLGGYAGPERRGPDAGAPGGIERRRNEPIGMMGGDIGAAAAAMRAENPNILADAEAMRAKAAAAGRIKEPAELRAQRHGAVLDKKAAGEDTTSDVDAGTKLEASRIVDQSGSPAANRIAASDPGSGKKADDRANRHLDKTFGVVLDSARQLDPAVDAARLREEFDFRVDLYLDQQQLAADSGGDPHLILRTIAKLGGLHEADTGKGLAGELKALGAGGKFGAVAGVPGVFAKKSVATTANKKTRGHGADVMLQMLQSDPRFAWIESVDMMLDQIDEAARHGANRIETGILPGTEELRDVGIRRELAWWVDAWAAGDMLADVDEAVIDTAQGDTSFDVTEFNQSLFDEFDALNDPGDADTLATGEVQPRLPEAGQVREQDVATPEVAELPFSLTAPIAKPGKKNAGQKTLFQDPVEGLTRESVIQWAADIKTLAGEDLRSFVVNLTTSGDIALDSIIVARGAQRAGLGSKVLKQLTRFADQHGRRLILTPGQADPIHGTTSRSRLVTFYKRFGFVENKGRHKDFRISAGMLREPNVPFELKAQTVEQRTADKTEPTTSSAYQAASAAMTAADAVFGEATRKYRTREIDDAEYLAARATHDAAVKAFDAAFEVEQQRELSQGEDEKERRGAIRFGADRQFTISLLEKADLSTFLHESGHLFLEVFGDLADQLRAVDAATLNPRQAQALTDYDALLKWLGVENRAAIGTDQHEQFARGFEAYLMEGRAPSQQLRTAFARYRAWLVGIYRSLKGLKVSLTPDVRRVMDRLVASEDAIRQAEAEGAILPMFTTADDAGMAPAEFELYRKDVAQASETARETLEVKVLAELQREQQAAWNTQRQEINDAVRVETYDMPVYQAITAMQRGTKPNGGPLVEGQVSAPIKLSRKLIADRYGADRLKRLPRPYVYTTDGGIDPDDAATLFGYTSGDELLKAIEVAEPMAQRIERETNRRMIEQHGSILLDGTLPERAKAALANEHREAIVRAELGALAKKRRAVSPFVRQAKQAVAAEKQEEIDQLTGQVRDLKATARGGAARINAALPPANVVREAAKLVIARMTVREVKPAVYWNAARRAGQKAIEAAARQDFDTAIAQKQQELMSLAVYREASTVLDDIEARVQRALDLSRPSAQKRLGAAGDSYLDQVNTLLDRYDFARQTGKALDRRDSLRQWVDALRAQDIPVEIPDDVIDDARRIHYTRLSVEELIGVTDALTHINHLAGLKDKLFKNKEQREFEVVRDQVADSIREHNTENPLPVAFRRPERVRRKIKELFASHARVATLAQLMDGREEGGPVWSAFVRPTNEAATAKEVRQASESKEFAAILDKHYPGRELNRLHDKLHIPAIGDSLTLDERIAVARNWGNETSRDRLLNDPQRQWNQQQIQAILDTLDANDLAYVQATFDYLEQFWPEIAAKQKRVTGLEPEKVEALEIVAKAGTIRGGYFPLVADSRYNAKTRQWEKLSEADLKRTGAYVSSTTKRGHVETRRKHARYTVKLEGGVIFTHIEQVVHDLTHHEMLIDVTRLLRDPKITDAFYDTVGDVVYDQFTSAIEAIAAGRLEGPKNIVDEAAQFMKSRTQVALLGWNLWTGLQQPLGLFNGADRVGAKWVAKGLFRWLTSPARMERTVKWIHETSPYMAGRARNATQELADLKRVFSHRGGWFDGLVRRVSNDVVTQQRILDSMLWHIGLMQRVADVPTWLGQYEKSKAAGETDDRAVALADQAVIDAQGSGRISDLAKVQRGGPVAQLYMTFYSYGSTTFNAAYRRAGRTDFKKPIQVAHFLGGLSLIYIFPAIGTVLLNHLVRGAGDDDDDLGDYLAEIGKESAASALNGMVLVRELALKGSRGYAGPAGARVLVMMNQLLDQAKQGELDDAAIAKALEVGGVFAGLPTAQIQRTVEGWRAVRDDDAPLSSLFFGAPQP